jgi:hypothetical protein
MEKPISQEVLDGIANMASPGAYMGVKYVF